MLCGDIEKLTSEGIYMSKNPFVSVVINNYNYSEFISEAIESVLKQTYKNFELIIVDDGSTDNSVSIIEQYHKQNQRIITPVYKKNGGQASAMNTGYNMAGGEIIALLDSDDYWFPEKLERIVKCHENYDIVQHNLLINGEQKYINLRNDVDWSTALKKYGYLLGYWVPTSGLSFSKALLGKVFPIPEVSLRLCADAYIIWNALYYSKIFSIDEALGFYRVHGNNNWHNKFNDERIKNTIDTILDILNEKLILSGESETIQYNSTLYKDLLGLFIEKDKKYVLYGTGSLSEEFTRIVEQCESEIVYYSDSNSDKWGKHFMGREIIPPEDLLSKREHFDKIVIASSFIDEILIVLEKLGFVKASDIIVPQL